MGSGSSGVPGRAVPRLVVGVASRDRDCVMDPSLLGSHAPVTAWKYSVATRRDAQVQCNNVSQYFTYTLYIFFLIKCNFLCNTEPHEICDEENFSDVVWKRTPAGDTAAVRCPPNAAGKRPNLKSRLKFIRQKMQFTMLLKIRKHTLLKT